MFDVDLKRTKTIKKDIINCQKRKAFTFDSKLIFKIVIPLFLYMITAWVALFEFGQIALAFCFPFILIGGTIIFTINETRIFLKEKKTNDNLEEIVKALEQVDIKTNVKKILQIYSFDAIIHYGISMSWYNYIHKANRYEIRG